MTPRGEPLRIVYATHNYPRFPGDPAGAFVARLAQRASAVGHTVHVLAPHAPGTPEQACADGVSLHRFRYAPERFERVGYRGDLHRASTISLVGLVGVPAFLAAFARALHGLVREVTPDLIHAHWWLPAGWLASRVGVPYVVTCHGSDVRLLDRSPVFRVLARGVLASARAVTTVSGYLARELRAHYPGLTASVLPLPLDVPHFARGRTVRKADPPRILYAGNLIETKGVSDLIEAFTLLQADRMPCELKILGEGPMAADLRAQALARGVDSAVRWSGFVSQDVMPGEYGASTVTVLPTRAHAEGLGLTLVEALLAGSAVVGTAAGGIPEVVVHECTGLLAPDRSPVDLAAQIRRLLTDSSLRSRLTEEGRRRAELTYSAEAATARFLALYHAVVDDRAAA